MYLAFIYNQIFVWYGCDGMLELFKDKICFITLSIKKPQKEDKELKVLEKELKKLDKKGDDYSYPEPNYNSGMTLIGTWSGTNIVDGEAIVLFSRADGEIYRLGTLTTEKGNKRLVLRKLQAV